MNPVQRQFKDGFDPLQVLTCIRDVVTVIDREGKIEYINYVLPGYDIDKVIGSYFYEYLDKSSHDEIRRKMNRVWDTGEDAIYHVEYYDEKGRHIWYETRVHAYRPSGKTEYLVQTARDMTLGHKESEDLQARQQELEQCVEERTRELTELNYKLNQKNQALKEVFSQLEEEKKSLEQNIVANFEAILMPILARLKRAGVPEQHDLFEIMEKKLARITSSYGFQISNTLNKLTPSEIQVCNLIRSGMKTKDIARILRCSHLTIDTHRTKIRKKLGISNQQVNLEAFLQNLK
ncbi:MAG: PAS domain-containing protein [Candidatus Omnitrophica bacterium]|nr:PAS domain-containing protein [Candidatus Omnitrophota bacterium]